MAEVWRGDFLECVHLGHAVIADASGGIVRSWGDPEAVILPRSSCKMIQALPLVESGADLTTEQLALACASHNGAEIHVSRVGRWLAELGLSDDALRCGPQDPDDEPEHARLIRAHAAPAQMHNNCSGKHAGFLTLTQRMGAGPEYVDPAHPVQRAVREAFEEVTDQPSPGYVIDGCSAPNFATTLRGLARAMAVFASAHERGTARDRAAQRLVEAMVAHPALVAGEGRACTGLMRAMDGVAVKTGAEGVFVAILPRQRLGVALKIADGATRASEAAIAAILVLLGVLDPARPEARRLLHRPTLSRRGALAGEVRYADALGA
ncbi:asparaginase [Rhodobacteraceae bacterium MCCB 386]|nr:asparaginase [Roseitranquillus sediminis]